MFPGAPKPTPRRSRGIDPRAKSAARTGTRGPRLGSWVMLALYVAIIAVVATRHEMWRDEVRAWTVATRPESFAAMVGAVRAEGHPLVWYCLLRFGHLLFHSPWVLPATSLAVAATAAWLFLRSSPFPWVWKALFLLGTLALYHYSVMCRNYGIGMLILWAIAARYEQRFERPLLHGMLLLLLANTSAHAAIIAAAFTLAWGWEAWRGRATPRTASVLLGIGVALAGIAAAALICYPSSDSAVTGLRQASAGSMAQAALESVVGLAAPFRRLVTASLPLTVLGFSDPEGAGATTLISTALLVLVAWRHRRDLDLLIAFAATVLVLGWFFRVVYPPPLRHVGLLYVTILALEWIARRREERTGRAPSRAGTTLAFALPAVMAMHAGAAVADIRQDLQGERSSSRAFAAFLRSRPELRDAIVVGEPDYLIESLPYYTEQRLYSVEEGRLFRWVNFSRSVRDTLSLGALLDAVERLARAERVPVLLALGHLSLSSDSTGDLPYRYGSRFTWTPEERRRLELQTTPLAEFTRAYGDENYVVLRADTSRALAWGARHESAGRQN